MSAFARRLPVVAVTVAAPRAPGSTVTVLPEVCVTFVPPKVTFVGTAAAIVAAVSSLDGQTDLCARQCVAAEGIQIQLRGRARVLLLDERGR